MDKDDPRLLQFVLGELPAAESVAIQDAIDESTDLQIVVEELTEVAALLERQYESEPLPQLLDEQVQTIYQHAKQHTRSVGLEESLRDSALTDEQRLSTTGVSNRDVQPASRRPKPSTAFEKSSQRLVLASGVVALGLLVATLFVVIESHERSGSPTAHADYSPREVDSIANQEEEEKKEANSITKSDARRIQENQIDKAWDLQEIANSKQSEDKLLSNLAEASKEAKFESLGLSQRNLSLQSTDNHIIKQKFSLVGPLEENLVDSSNSSPPFDLGGQIREVRAADTEKTNGITEFYRRAEFDSYSFGLPPQQPSTFSIRNLGIPRASQDAIEHRFDELYRKSLPQNDPRQIEFTEKAFLPPVEEEVPKKPPEKLTFQLDRSKLQLARQLAGLADGITDLRTTDSEHLLEHRKNDGKELSQRRLAIGAEKRNSEMQKPQGRKPESLRVQGTTAVTRSWKKVAATPNTSRLMVGDKDELPMQGIQANVLIEGFRARVVLDCFYFNNFDKPLEGTFKIRLPDDSSLFYFAFGESAYQYQPDDLDLTQHEFGARSQWVTDARQHNTAQRDKQQQWGLVSRVSHKIHDARRDDWRNVKEARCVEKQKAAFAYSQTVKRRIDPALVEWAGAGVFNARVFPLAPQKMHRVVIGYDVDLTRTSSALHYQFALPQNIKQSLVRIDVARTSGLTVESADNSKPAQDDRYFRFNFKDSSKPIALQLRNSGTTLLRGPNQKYFALQVPVNIRDNPINGVAPVSSKAIFLLDTSASSQPEKFNLWLELLKEVLEQNRDQVKEFAVLIFNVENYWWKEEFTQNNQEQIDQLLQDCQKLVLEGATDLHSAFTAVNQADWISSDQPLDCFLLSDGAATWGETYLLRIEQQLKLNRGRRLIAYQTGSTGTAIGLLRYLAQNSGGAVFTIASEAETRAAAIAHRNRPWKLKSIEMDGGRDLLTAGRIQWLYPGQLVTLVGRGNPSGNVVFNLERDTSKTAVRIPIKSTIESSLAERTYGQVAVGQLESLGELEKNVAVAYARNFQITGRYCSLLMLESKQDYQRFEIESKNDPLLVGARPVSDIVSDAIQQISTRMRSHKSEVLSWLQHLQNSPGQEFKFPAALNLVIKDLSEEQFSVQPKKLVCQNRSDAESNRARSSRTDRLTLGQLGKRLQTSDLATHDRVRALSNLIESNPGNYQLNKAVAQEMLRLELPSHGFYLLKRAVSARPFDSDNYLALGNCLFELQKFAYGMVCYEVALNSTFTNRKKDFRKIVAHDYARLLQKTIASRSLPQVIEYAKLKLEQLRQDYKFEDYDLAVKLSWNTDSSDIDLHVTEPSGEKCYYQNPDSRSGGHLTSDITDGFGPELYTLKSAPAGKYKIQLVFYSRNQNRTQASAQATVEIIQNYGRSNEKITRKAVNLTKQKETIDILTIGID